MGIVDGNVKETPPSFGSFHRWNGSVELREGEGGGDRGGVEA